MNHAAQARLVIVGAGNAGAELAMAARQQGYAGEIELLGDEAHLPYHRPPLSKAYLSGTALAETLALRPLETYERAIVRLRTSVRVASLDLAAQRVRLADGGEIHYTQLALCTGGRARPLACAGLAAGAAPRNLHYLRHRDDADALRAQLAPGRRLAVIGGGYVGLEVAASARQRGAEVVLLEAEARLLSRVTGAQMSRFYAAVHRSRGVDVRMSTRVENLECDAAGEIVAVHCDDGRRIDVDAVVAGIGMLPNVEIARAAGIETDGGIVVDGHSRTSDPRVFAAGDCTVHDSALYGRRIRLESVPNALEQARAAAHFLCGKPKENRGVPWFWSDQYDLKLQMTGLSQGHDAVVLRGSLDACSFAAFYLKQGAVIAADAVNRPADFMVAKKLVENAAHADPVQLADPAFELRHLLPPRAASAG